jgi:hypothetical protein
VLRNGLCEQSDEVAQVLTEFAERCVTVDQTARKDAEMGLRGVTPTAQQNP